MRKMKSGLTQLVGEIIHAVGQDELKKMTNISDMVMESYQGTRLGRFEVVLSAMENGTRK